MARRNRWKTASAIVLAMSMAGCGGGINSTPPPPVAVTPTPVPTPTPTPTPTPAPRPLTYTGPIGLRSAEPFAVYGLGHRYTTDPDGYSNPRNVSGSSRSDVVEFRYLASQNAYEILLPGYERGRLDTIHHNGTVCSNGSVCDPSSTGSRVLIGDTSAIQNVLVILPVPGKTYPLPGLTYTNLGSWEGRTTDPSEANRMVHNNGLFAYGIATAAGDVPISGTATYHAAVIGTTSYSSGYVDGSARLVFDFAAGSLSGYMRPMVAVGWEDSFAVGQYDFTQTVFGVGSQTFSGKFIVPGSTADSFFEGGFNGPQAAELMARWQAPYLDPANNSWGTMFGVWVGKKN